MQKFNALISSSCRAAMFVFLIFLSTTIVDVRCKQRSYYIGAVEVDWDYAPSGKNKVNGMNIDSDSDAAVFSKRGKDRIGRVYKKTIYRPFTDITFTKQAPHPLHLGIMGPVIKGEVNDEILVYFKNFGRRNFSVHPHGVFYKKGSEGALYNDNTSGFDKGDDHVPPNGIRTYTWRVLEEFAPAAGDPNCLTWLYHSHVNPVKDINTGLIGTLLTCKKGHLDDRGKRNDVDKEFFLLFTVLDENKSWLLDDNLRANKIDPKKFNKEDEGFQESNLLHGINGLFYGNLEGIDMCIDDRVSWHISGLGNEVDIHTAYFSGNTIVAEHHRTDVEVLFPARSATATMTVKNPGTWMLSCQVADHYSAGMIAFYNAKGCNKVVENAKMTGETRTYYIAADELEWDYGPSGKNLFDGGSLTAPGSKSAIFFSKGPNRVGGKYIKALYREYTDATFSILKKRKSPDEDHLGILGPVIRAEVGDKIALNFKNKATRPYSIHPHGVLYNKANEGAKYQDGSKDNADDAVAPNKTFTYSWTIPESLSPTENDPPCISYLYSSAVDRIKDAYSGLVGPLVICKRGSLTASGTPSGYKGERFLYFAIIDENKSWYLDRNMDKYCTKPKCNGVDKENEEFVESNKMHQINGYKYGNLPNLTLCKGEKVLWHVIGIGTEADIHTLYFHGNTFDDLGNHKDTIAALPGTFSTFSMTPDNPGKWPLVCRTNNHLTEGMKMFYTVQQCKDSKDATASEKVRTYHIGIVEREWDYAPTNHSLIRGYALEEAGRESRVFVHRGPKSIGKVYMKSIYREFTDGTFTKEKIRGEEDMHLGILGPILIAEEGEQIHVVLKNMAKRSYSIHPHGLFYKKTDEGASYQGSDSSPGVSPGKTRTYKWNVPARAAPGPKDSACITWAYYSSLDPVKDTNSGLVGPLIICKKGTLGDKRKRTDIDRAFALFFTVMDENESWYLDDNIKKYIGKGAVINKEDEGFKESNKMHVINGFIYGNSRHFKMKEDENVNWYLMGLGGEVDMHTVHFHGHTFIHRTDSKHREDVYDLFPGIYATLEMKADNPGVWLLHCHVNDHIDGGMETLYTIRQKGEE